MFGLGNQVLKGEHELHNISPLRLHYLYISLFTFSEEAEEEEEIPDDEPDDPLDQSSFEGDLIHQKRN